MAGFQKAKKEKVWTKVLLGGASGSGKSYSALRLATGLANKTGSRIAAIDTEAGRIRYYANEFDFDDMQLTEPYTPQKYIDAIDEAIKGGYQILIIDSISHEWNYCVETHDKMPGNSYTNWAKITPMHDRFMEKVLQSPLHVIATVRGKDEYVLEEKNGKQAPKKVGLGYKQRDGVEYNYTVTFNIDQETHISSVSKDNTHIFEGKFEVLTEKDGEALYDWANSGETLVEKTYDLPKLREDIIARAKELGGSKNPSVTESCERLIGTLNPNKSEDGKALTQLLDELKVIEVSKEGDK